MFQRSLLALSAAVSLTFCLGGAVSAVTPTLEYNPVHSHSVSIGPEASRLIIGFRVLPGNATVATLPGRNHALAARSIQAQTSAADVAVLTQRASVHMAKSRQLTPSMHVIYLEKTLYGADVGAALKVLRADSAVEFVDVDQRRFPHSVPNDPLFVAAPGVTGQWYMQTPTATGDASATDAVSAWTITTGSTGTVIADVDTGVRFEHPDLMRAGLGSSVDSTSRSTTGGRLLPGYDFIAEDQNTAGASLGTFLIANDGDGYDPDPSDPGDWLTSTDLKNPLFPPATCDPAGNGFSGSSWHGTRVMGILGALTDNTTGIAGMTWEPYLLPVRALGKCGGYDSDIIVGMQWAAGLPVTGVPNNPYPADIINLSLGGGSVNGCPSEYASVIPTLIGMGVLIVASAGNESGPVDSPADCPGVLAVAGLRNIGTKVGYSSLGPEVGVSAPAGNCVNLGGPCLKSIDTTSNAGLQGPSATSTYTDQTNINVGTSFSAPIVSGIAALMRAVNANLTPAQLIARIQAGATPFPQPVGVPLCVAGSTNSQAECTCPNVGGRLCGAGMVNALNAVNQALLPIAAVSVPTNTQTGSSALLDAGGSAASCTRTIVSYLWTASGGVTIASGANTSQVSVVPNGAVGTVILKVTDSAGSIDTASLGVTATGVISKAPTTPINAGTSASACPTPLSVVASAPTVTQSFSPASVGTNSFATLTVTFTNTNPFALTQSAFTETVPAGLTLSTSSSNQTELAATTCLGGSGVLTKTSSAVVVAGAIIPASGSCTVTVPMQGATVGNYVNTIAPSALTTGPAGASGGGSSMSTLTVSPPGKHGGGAVDGWDALFAVGVILAGRRHARRSVSRD